MKSLILTIAVFMSYSLSSAQNWQYGTISEVKTIMSQGDHNAFTVDIAQANPERAADAWEQYARKFKAAKKKYDRRSREYLIDDAVLPDISANSVDIYTRIQSNGSSGTTVHMWFDLGGAYINCHDHPDKGMMAKQIVENYVQRIIQEEASFAVHSEEELMRGIKKELTKLQRDQRKIQKKISKTESLLQELNTALTENQANQIAKRETLDRQESIVENARAELKKIKS